jgi:hypothetical protein
MDRTDSNEPPRIGFNRKFKPRFADRGQPLQYQRPANSTKS